MNFHINSFRFSTHLNAFVEGTSIKYAYHLITNLVFDGDIVLDEAYVVQATDGQENPFLGDPCDTQHEAESSAIALLSQIASRL